MNVIRFMSLAVMVVTTAACAAPSPGEGSGKDSESSPKAWLGVSVSDVGSKIAKEHGLEKPEGAYVRDVMRNSPADSAGIKEGDIIVEFNGVRIADADELVSAVREADAGSKVKIAVLRKGDRKELWAVTKKQPRKRVSFAFTPPDVHRSIRFLRGPGSQGLSLIPLNPQLGRYFEVPDGKGLLVEKVKEGSPAEKAGFQAGDVIVRVGNTAVDKVREFRSELAEYEEGDKVSVEIVRKGSRKMLTMEIEEGNADGFEFSFNEGDVFDGPGHFELEVPDPEELKEFHMEFDAVRPELDRLQKEIDRLRRRIEESANGLKEKMIRQFRERNVMSEI